MNCTALPWPPRAAVRHCSIAVITRRCAVEMTAPTSARKAVTVAAEDLRYRERGAWEEHGVPVMIGGSVDGLPAQPARSTTNTSSAHNSRMSAPETLAGRRTFPDAARPLQHEEASSLPIVAIPDLPIRLARGFSAPVRPTVGTNDTRRVHCLAGAARPGGNGEEIPDLEDEAFDTSDPWNESVANRADAG